MEMAVFVVDAAQQGQRLDKALAAFLPQLGLRARRRLWEEGDVLINGRPRPAGYTVCAGDEVCVRGREKGDPKKEWACRGGDRPFMLQCQGELLFVHKPSGVHTVRLERKDEAVENSLESLLPGLLPESDENAVHLLNRLDFATSGIVLAARGGKDAAAAHDWRAAENAGLCRKSYVALLCGHLPAPRTVPYALATDKRRVTRVLPEMAPPLRHTLLEPIAHVRAEDVRALAPWSPTLASCAGETALTLAHCVIHKGARHQIRAHAAYAGFPLWGDGRYKGEGADPVAQREYFVLHHGMLCIPGAAIFDVCPWLSLLPEKIANDIAQRFNKNKTLP